MNRFGRFRHPEGPGAQLLRDRAGDAGDLLEPEPQHRVQQKSFSLAPYIGQKITIKFTGSEDSSLQTSFVIDDNALNVN